MRTWLRSNGEHHETRPDRREGWFLIGENMEDKKPSPSISELFRQASLGYPDQQEAKREFMDRLRRTLHIPPDATQPPAA
jgi:hypothetical protein